MRKCLNTVFSILFIFLPFSASASTIGLWTFENGTTGSTATGTGTIIDSSGNNLHGTPYGGPKYIDGSMDFDGVNDGVSIPDSSKFAITNNISIEANIFARDATPYGIILGRFDDRGMYDPYFLQVGNGKVSFFLTEPSNYQAVVASSVNIPLNEFVHIAATLNGSTGEMNLYFNGGLVGSQITWVRPLENLDINYNPGIGIGNLQSTTYNTPFNGLIDYIRLSDVALDPTQFLYDDTPSPVPGPSTLLLMSSGLTVLMGIGRRRMKK